MLFLMNLNKYIFAIEPTATVDVTYLKSKGCVFFESLNELYEKSAEVQDLTVEEVEDCELSVLYSKLQNKVVCIDQRGCGSEIVGKLEDYIATFSH